MTLDPAIDIYPWRDAAGGSVSGPAPRAPRRNTDPAGRRVEATSEAAPAAPLVALLRQIARMIGSLRPLQYEKQPVGVLAGSVGGHVRHGLDHVEALLAALETGAIDYEKRRRGSLIETHPTAAFESIASLEERLLRIDASQLDRVVRVRTLLARDAPPLETVSTFGRELAYVVSHTTHHNAILAAMAKTLGSEPPEHFGFAPSTIVHLDRVARVSEGPRSGSRVREALWQ